MSLDTATLKSSIRAAMDELTSQKSDVSLANSKEIFADRLASAIDAFVRSGTVTSTGTATAVQSGGSTAPVTSSGTIS